VTLSAPRQPAQTMSPLTWLCQKRIDSSRHPALPAGSNNGKSWQLLYQPIRTHEHALTAGLIPDRSLLFCSICGCASFLGRLSAGFLCHFAATQLRIAPDHFGIYRLRAFHIRTESRAISPRSVVSGLSARG
jgi:hypothetical protein